MWKRLVEKVNSSSAGQYWELSCGTVCVLTLADQLPFSLKKFKGQAK